jgi:hypothetical protein
MGWYSKVNTATGEVSEDKLRAKALDGEFWEPILKDQAFKDFLKNKYEIGHATMIKGDISE